MKSDPIFNVQEVEVSKLRANDWNPNVVFNKELDLLEQSIVLNGWIHPIIVNRNFIIIDGFHRAHLAKTSAALLERDGGMVPCVVLDIDDKEAKMLTVRINRAKGTHAALRMRDLVQDLIDNYETTPDEMIQKMGMTEGEIGLLYDGGLLKKKDLQSRKYSRAWVPVETRLMTDEERMEFERDQDES